MNNDCFCDGCPMRINTTSSVHACYRQNCASRIASVAIMTGALAMPPVAAYEDCLGCQHFEVCKDAELKLAPCEHRLPYPTIDENRMKRVFEQVEAHGGIYHLVELDQLACQGRLVILPKDPAKQKTVLDAITKVLMHTGGVD
jgi:hypothetical protein